MNKKRSYIIIFSLLFILTIGIIFIDYSKQLSAILADATTPNPGHALEEIGGRETLVTTSGDQTIAGVKTFSDGIIAPKYCIGDECIESWSLAGTSNSDDILIIVDGSTCPEGYFIDRILLGDCHVEGSCRMSCPSLGWVIPGNYYCATFMPSPLWGCLSSVNGEDCLRPINKTRCIKNDYNDYYLSTTKQIIYGEKIFKNGLWISQSGNVRIGGTNVDSAPSSQLEIFGNIDLRGNIKTSSNPFNIQTFSGVNLISFTQNGNVGIGKSPSVRLDVDGKIKATEIEVTKVISTGSVKIGDSSLDCSSSEEGSVKYNQSTKNLEVCNGSSWISFSQKACQLDGLPQTTSWGDNQYYCMGDNYRCFNGECKMCAGSLIDGKCWYSVSGQQTPCLERGGVDNPYYADPSDCTICSTLVKNTEYWLGQPISCEGSSDYGPMAMSTGPRHYNEIKCYYHNSSSNRESPPGYPPYMPYGGTFWAPCKY